MPTLVLHTPRELAGSNGRITFAQTIAGRVAKGFAIPSTVIAKANLCQNVIIMEKASKRAKRAEIIKPFTPSVSAKNGIKRYDISFECIEDVDYCNIPLLRTGIAIIP